MFKKIALTVVLLAAAHVGYAYYSVNQLRVAIETGDVALLDRKVDWPALRSSVKSMLSSKMQGEALKGVRNNDAAAIFGNAIGGALADRMIETMVTPAGVINLINSNKGAAGSRSFDMNRIVSAMPVSPTRFEVKVSNPNEKDPAGLLVFNLVDFEWKLTGVVPLKPW